MSDRELVVLGTASQAPTRSRNHNGYLLRWDGEGLLFDPGEGTQRQMIFAGVTGSQITRICVTHFHGDHCLGLPGVLQRMSLDRVRHVVDACYPAQNREVFTRLRHAALFRDVVVSRRDGVRGEIRQFLITRRAKITPEQAGLRFYGANRRVPGLRREEVALLAGISIEYYTRLERGNATGVSDQVLDAIGRALQLDDVERAHLADLVKAANAARPARRRSARQRVRPSVQLAKTLYVTEGRGLHQPRGGQIEEIRAGDIVYTPAGQWHWHGAAPGHYMTHLSITEAVPGDQRPETDWGEHVTDEEYNCH